MPHPVAERDLYIGCHGDVTGWGGAAVQGRGLASTCQARGWQTFVLGWSSEAEAATTTQDGCVALNVRVAPQRMIWRLHAWCIPRMLAWRLRQLARPRAFVSFSPFWTVAAKRTWPDVPVLFRYCGLLSRCAECNRLPNVAPRFWEKVAQRSVRAAERAALRRADRVLVPAPEHAAEIAAFEPRATARVRESPESCPRLRWSADDRRSQRTQLSLAEHDFLILAIGTWDRNKAFDYAIRELAQADARAHLVIVGDGPDANHLKRLTRTLGLAARVRLVGRQPNLAPWYAAADCVTSTSWYDTYPNVIKEALSCGRPVVVPAHSPPHVYAGIAGLVQREQLGRTYDRLVPGALACCWNQLIADEPGRLALARRAANFAAQQFTWDDTLRQIELLADYAPAPSRPPCSRPVRRADRCLTTTSQNP